MATDINPQEKIEARRARIRHTIFVLRLAFDLESVYVAQFARALEEGGVRLPLRPLELPSYLDEMSTDLLERKQALLRDWLSSATLPEDWANWLVARLKPQTTLIRLNPDGSLYVEHDCKFAPPPKQTAN